MQMCFICHGTNCVYAPIRYFLYNNRVSDITSLVQTQAKYCKCWQIKCVSQPRREAAGGLVPELFHSALVRSLVCRKPVWQQAKGCFVLSRRIESLLCACVFFQCVLKWTALESGRLKALGRQNQCCVFSNINVWMLFKKATWLMFMYSVINSLPTPHALIHSQSRIL